jgi:DNA ligase-1
MLASPGALPGGHAHGFEFKWDGIRALLHWDGRTLRLFSRNAKDLTAAFPELHALADQLGPRSAVLDGEVVALDGEGRPDFGLLQQRLGRVGEANVRGAARVVPASYLLFDLLHLDGQDILGQSFRERQRLLRGLKLEGPAWSTTRHDTDGAAMLRTSQAMGLEGVVAKRLDSPYQAGARNFNWVKLKRNTSGQLNDTIDVVLLGYYRGKGKRAEFGAGALLAGVYDSQKDEFGTISKLGTGLSDQGWRDIHKRLASLEVAEKPARVNSIMVPDVWLKPEIVVEVLADEITPSPRHTAGMTADRPGFALRFPRIVSFRSEKKPEDATSVREVREMFEQQRQPGRGRPTPKA